MVLTAKQLKQQEYDRARRLKPYNQTMLTCLCGEKHRQDVIHMHYRVIKGSYQRFPNCDLAMTYSTAALRAWVRVQRRLSRGNKRMVKCQKDQHQVDLAYLAAMHENKDVSWYDMYSNPRLQNEMEGIEFNGRNPDELWVHNVRENNSGSTKKISEATSSEVSRANT